jgi:hypothetical protein
MLDEIGKRFGIKPVRSTSGMISVLRPVLKEKVLLIDNCHIMTKTGLRIIARLGTTFVAASNRKISIPYRVIVKLRRRSPKESMEIAKSMCDLDEREAKVIVRRSNGVPGTIRTLCEDVKTARRLGYNTLEFLDKAPLPNRIRVNTYYLLLGFASIFLSIRYVLYHFNFYDVGYLVAIFAYMIYSAMRFRRVVY